ncbi:uncharacterized protein TNCV_4317721 [Trichonephila clavipes]|nr:uncharacterized protein TNCV_4317721 [Trichonephila clavipes]
MPLKREVLINVLGNSKEIASKREVFIDTLQYLEAISVPRYVPSTSVKSIVAQGFADASLMAYGAVVSIQVASKTREPRSQLLCSKLRVAPLKIMTIPRLELSPCILLVKLTDKSFQQLSKDFQWRHISSKCNPADFLSQGLDAKTLGACELWWTGSESSTLDISTQDAFHQTNSTKNCIQSD